MKSRWRVRVVNSASISFLRHQKTSLAIHSIIRVLLPSTLLLFVLLNNGIAQSPIPPLERIVSISFQLEQSDEMLKKLSEQGGFIFSYSTKAFDSKKLFSGRFTNKTVREILEVLFEGRVQYKQKGNYIILTKSESTKDVIVSGYVVDESTGQKLKEVSVYDPVSLRSAITDEYGFFELSVHKPTAAEMKLAIQKRNYTDTLVVVSANRSSFQNISLNIDKEKWSAFTDSVDSKLKRVWSWTKRSVQLMNMRNIRDTINRTWQVSFVPFVGTNHRLSGNVVNDYSFNILGGYSAGTRKVEFGGLFNINRGDVEYAQFAGLFNLNGGEAKGAQFAGLFNTNLNSVNAAQFAGLINSNLLSSEGAQFAGLINTTFGSYKGVQVAGLINLVSENVQGAQIAGLMNINLKKVNGSQVAGLLNVANKISGSQVGFLNLADSISGIPVGFISLVNKGYHKIEIAADEIFPLNVSFRTGVTKFYNILTAGVRPESADTTTWSFGYGVGTAPKLSDKLFLNIDVTANQFTKGNVESLNLINKLYLGFDYQIAKKISLTVGATLNLQVYEADFTNHAKLFTYYTPSIISKGTFSNNTAYQMWWGAKVGIRFF